MKCKEYFLNLLIKYDLNEIFGLPGGVILDFLETVEEKLNPCLVFHEQSAVFSAIGYSRAKNGLGMAYATRGPGITNTLTSVADAYYDSVPLLILTGHSGNLPLENMRVLSDQEIDTVSIFKNVTKKSVRVDTAEEFMSIVESLIEYALQDRKGPVLIDVKSNIWNKEIPKHKIKKSIFNATFQKKGVLEEGLSSLKNALILSKRPILFLGDGFRGKKSAIKNILDFSQDNNIPILSSRFSQELFCHSENYFGYIGSHGLRSGNLILSKSDLLITIGNRLHYPTNSKSWAPLMDKLKVLWFDIDPSEFKRKIPNSNNYFVDLSLLLNEIKRLNYSFDFINWKKVCIKIKSKLDKFDVEMPITLLKKVFDNQKIYNGIISDVGNHEFWVARAYYESRSKSKMIFSKSFGAMGSAIGKAIGFVHATGENVLCFVGDQGLMMNIQELHYIIKNNLPVKIFLMNNKSSGMIRSRQKDSERKIIQTTISTGYSIPNFIKVAQSFGMPAFSFDGQNAKFPEVFKALSKKGPILIELIINEEFEGRPHLKVGYPPAHLSPQIPNDILSCLESL